MTADQLENSQQPDSVNDDLDQEIQELPPSEMPHTAVKCLALVGRHHGVDMSVDYDD